MVLKALIGVGLIMLGVSLPIAAYYTYIRIYGFLGAMDTGPLMAVIWSIPFAVILFVSGVTFVILSIIQDIKQTE